MGNIATRVNEIIGKAPEWMRHDLNSKDPAARMRAEEALAAMVVNVLEPEKEERR